MDGTFIIAEVGINHNGDIKKAYELIERAAATGANAIKFQTAIPELVVSKHAQKANYQKTSTENDESQLEMIRKNHLPLTAYEKLKKTCEERGIMFFSSAFDLKSLSFLEELGQPYHKVPSGEITNLPYLRQIAAYPKPVILSTGMSEIDEIRDALEVFEEMGKPRDQITLLHCNTEYPTPMRDVNLMAMQTLKKTFNLNVGYSDHTDGIEVAIAAVALGACIIEKHLTLSKNLPGPDHRASLEPEEFADMVTAIRNIETALGDGKKYPSVSESKNIAIARRSIVAHTKIKKGDIFSADNIIAKRPGTGISPMKWDEVIGRKSRHDFEIDDLIVL